MNCKKKIIRVTTIPDSLDTFCNGMLKELSEKYEVIGLSSPGKCLDIVAAREGIRVISVPMERHISLLKDLVSLWKMCKVFIKEKPDMVHSMTPKAGLISMMAALIARVPIRVHTFTGLVFPTATGLKKRLLMITDKITCLCSTHVIPEGEGVKNDLLKNGITNKPLKVLGYGNVKGVDMTFYSRRSEVIDIMNKLKLRDDSFFTFLFVGRIVRDKGVNELVEAFSELHVKSRNTRLWLIGVYEDMLDPINEATRNEIRNNNEIKILGQVIGDELLAYYSAADCFILPSYREGFPNTVLEAGAMGLPSIVTDINGSREIIEEGKNGVIVPPRDVGALLNAMKNMIKDEDCRKRMANNARGMISERFEQRFVRKCLYNFYDDILN